MEIVFLGTNGWYSTKTGNTPSILIKTKKRYIVLDMGDGVYKLDRFVDNNNPIDVFLSHFHLDHIYGFHIQPKIKVKNKITIFGQPNTKKILQFFINKPFTAPLRTLKKEMQMNIKIKHLKKGENNLGEYKVVCKPLIHADPCWGFRFIFKEENKTKVITYCTDTGPSKNFEQLAKNSDILISECSLLAKDKINPYWPHLNPQTAASLAKKSKTKLLLLTHFAADKYTTKKLRLEAQRIARKIFPNSIAAYDLFKVQI